MPPKRDECEPNRAYRRRQSPIQPMYMQTRARLPACVDTHLHKPCGTEHHTTVQGEEDRHPFGVPILDEKRSQARVHPLPGECAPPLHHNTRDAQCQTYRSGVGGLHPQR